jgi:hypothetical protein
VKRQTTARACLGLSVGPTREHAKITPVNHLPNPYETVRNWGERPGRLEV